MTKRKNTLKLNPQNRDIGRRNKTGNTITYPSFLHTIFGVFYMRFLAMFAFIACVGVSSLFAQVTTSATIQTNSSPTITKSPEELLAGKSSKTWDVISQLNVAGAEINGLFHTNTYAYKPDGTYILTYHHKQMAQPMELPGKWKIEGKYLITEASNHAITKQVIDELTEANFKLSYEGNQAKCVMKAR
ncbi:MAG: hypothetical protein ACOVSW_02620 [Candidatus Kapaibacteriota bacterium]